MSKVTHNQRLDLTIPLSTTDSEGFECGTHSSYSSPCDISALLTDFVSLTRGLPLALDLFAHALQVALVEGKTQHHRGHQLRLCVSNSAQTLSHNALAPSPACSPARPPQFGLSTDTNTAGCYDHD